jgi:ABC-type uncharacterized transport system substrate-binding protein
MERRKFIALLGGAAAAWPIAARAQQSAKPRTIGFMGASAPAAVSTWVAAFQQRLRELGWIEGRNVAIEYHWAEGRFERLAGFAAEFVRQGVDIIVARAPSRFSQRSRRLSPSPSSKFHQRSWPGPTR